MALGQGDVEGGVLSLSPAAPGLVGEVPVSVNQVVQAGAVLVQLDDKTARARSRWLRPNWKRTGGDCTYMVLLTQIDRAVLVAIWIASTG